MIDRHHRTERDVISLSLGGKLLIHSYINNEVTHYAEQSQESAKDFFRDDIVASDDASEVSNLL